MMDRVLIVEDSPMMRHLYRAVMEPRVGSLLFAETGAEGLDRAAQTPDLDLVIVDINMPAMDGIEFLERFRSELGLTDVPALVVSTEAEEADRQMARDAGADGFLAKPWTSAQLWAAITDLAGGEEGP